MLLCSASTDFELVLTENACICTVYRLFSGKGEKLKTVDFKTGAGIYIVNTQKGSYNISGDRVETLGMNMYVVLH